MPRNCSYTNLYKNFDSKTDTEIKQIADKELNRRIESIQIIIEKNMYNDLRKADTIFRASQI